jgi:hypothetical protein
MASVQFRTQKAKGSEVELFVAWEFKENMPPGYIGTEHTPMVEADFRAHLGRQGLDEAQVQTIVSEARKHRVE